MLRLAAIVIVVLVLSPLPALAGPWDRVDTHTVRNDAELRAALRERIPPGATLLIAPGRYTGGVEISSARGAEGKPIVIGAADPKQPPTFAGGSVGLLVRDPAHLTLRDLIIDGPTANGVNIDDGGSMTLSATNITLRHVVIRNVRGRGNNDGLKLSGLKTFTLDGCTIADWGAGGSGIDMVGCHDGTIVACKFSQTVEGPSNCVQAKGGSTNVTIDRCDFQTAGQRGVNLGGHTGMQFFRPQPPGKFEAKDLTVRRCAFRGGMSPVNFVGVDGAVVEDCVIHKPTRWIVRILQENRDGSMTPSRGGIFRRNVIVYESAQVRSPVNVGGGTAPDTFTFEANQWFCPDSPQRSKPQLPTPEKQGVYGVDPKFRDAEQGDFRRDK